MLSFIWKMLTPNDMEKYVKKEKKDDLRSGFYFLIGALLLEFIVAIFLAGLSNSLIEAYPEDFIEDIEAGLVEKVDLFSYSVEILFTSIVELIGYVIGLSAIYYFAKLMKGNAKYGEWMYLAGRLVFLFAIIEIMLLFIDVLMPTELCSCFFLFVMIAYLIYFVYMFMTLIGSLFRVSKTRALIILLIGILAGQVTYYLLSFIVLAITGMDVAGFEEIKEYVNLINDISS